MYGCGLLQRYKILLIAIITSSIFSCFSARSAQIKSQTLILQDTVSHSSLFTKYDSHKYTILSCNFYNYRTVFPNLLSFKNVSFFLAQSVGLTAVSSHLYCLMEIDSYSLLHACFDHF